jgi:hypothetical protein
MTRRDHRLIAEADRALAALEDIDAGASSWLRGALDALLDEDGAILDHGSREEAPVDADAYHRGLSAGSTP